MRARGEPKDAEDEPGGGAAERSKLGLAAAASGRPALRVRLHGYERESFPRAKEEGFFLDSGAKLGYC